MPSRESIRRAAFYIFYSKRESRAALFAFSFSNHPPTNRRRKRISFLYFLWAVSERRQILFIYLGTKNTLESLKMKLRIFYILRYYVCGFTWLGESNEPTPKKVIFHVTQISRDGNLDITRFPDSQDFYYYFKLVV